MKGELIWLKSAGRSQLGLGVRAFCLADRILATELWISESLSTTCLQLIDHRDQRRQVNFIVSGSLGRYRLQGKLITRILYSPPTLQGPPIDLDLQTLWLGLKLCPPTESGRSPLVESKAFAAVVIEFLLCPLYPIREEWDTPYSF